MDRKDIYYNKAKKNNFRSRAAFKLLELQSKFDLIDENSNVLEFGSAPGGWTQVIGNITEKKIICIDINKMNGFDNIIFLQGNILDENLNKKIKEILINNNIQCISTVLSDAMVHTSGDSSRDHYESYRLCENVMNHSIDLLCNGGNVVLKQFQGDMTTAFVEKWRKEFKFYKVTKPQASRPHSREVYIIFKGKR